MIEAPAVNERFQVGQEDEFAVVLQEFEVFVGIYLRIMLLELCQAFFHVENVILYYVGGRTLSDILFSPVHCRRLWNYSKLCQA